MSGPIFGNSNALGGSSGGNRHLVEFKAGRMNMVGKMVHPDLRKGLIYMYQAEDGLIHFCWKDRASGVVEDDLIIFPDDCEFKRLEICTTGRAFLLKFKSSTRKLFFWLQEPKTEKDEEWLRRVNEIMNNPPSMNNVSSARGGGGSGGADGTDLQYMLNNMSQQQLMQLFGGVGQMGGLSTLLGSMNRPSGTSSSRQTTTTTTAGTTTTTTATPSRTTTTVTSGTTPTPASVVTPTNTSSSIPSTPQAPKKTKGATTSSRGPSTPASSATASSTDTSRVLLSELQNYLSGLNPNRTEASASRRNVDLSTAINSDSVGSVLSDPSVVSALQAHLPNVETGDNTKDQLKETLTSPQFQQALSMFSSALQSGQLGPVVSQFQLNPEAVAAANSGDLEQFIKALEKVTTKVDDDEKDEKKEDKKDTKDDNDDMQLG